MLLCNEYNIMHTQSSPQQDMRIPFSDPGKYEGKIKAIIMINE